jgi:hypothetical protein
MDAARGKHRSSHCRLSAQADDLGTMIAQGGVDLDDDRFFMPSGPPIPRRY